MFLNFYFKNLSTVVLATCTILSSCNCALAQTSNSYDQIRNLPAVDAQKRLETGEATRLFTIKDKKPVQPVSHLNKARIVSGKNFEPSEAQSQSNWSSPAFTAEASPPIARVTTPQPIVVDNTFPPSENLNTGYYTVSFATPQQSPEPDEDVTPPEPDSPALEGLETEDELDYEEDDDFEEDDFDDDEDDAPIVRPEFGPWPRKTIRQVGLDLAEHGAKSPEDRSSRLFNSSRRVDGNIAASEKVFAWAAPNISYQPLYFEDVALERYGQTKGLVKQPFVSAGRFLADKVLLGTRALRVPPKSCDSPLGYCRPGSPSTVTSGGCGCNCLSRHGDCQSCR